MGEETIVFPGILAIDEGGWQFCDSQSNAMCLARRCTYAHILYLIDESSPEIMCERPAGEKWKVKT